MKTILYKYQLNTIYDTRKSFYGKSYYFKSNDNAMIILYSYDTPIVICSNFNKGGDYSRIYINKDYFDYSQTTLRHFKEFIKQVSDAYPYIEETLQGNNSLDILKTFYKYDMYDTTTFCEIMNNKMKEYSLMF